MADLDPHQLEGESRCMTSPLERHDLAEVPHRYNPMLGLNDSACLTCDGPPSAWVHALFDDLCGLLPDRVITTPDGEKRAVEPKLGTPTLVTDGMVDAFKRAWGKAVPGSRTRAGLEAALKHAAAARAASEEQLALLADVDARRTPAPGEHDRTPPLGA